jgi:uncharacterized protein YjbJ (UPF0337 family)
MSATDKAKNTVQDLRGKAKGQLGKGTDNQQWQVEGKADQVKADLK